MKTRKANIKELCTVERAVSGKLYRAGTLYVKLSAVDESVGQLQKPGTIESRYAALEPKDGIDPAYLFISAERAFPHFLWRYRTTINLQEEALQHFELDWHDDKGEQKQVVESILAVQDAVAQMEKLIEKEKQVKQWYLRNMLI